MTYNKLIKQLEKDALKNNREKEAIKYLLLEMSGLNGAEFILQLNRELTDVEVKNITDKANMYIIDNIPVQQILGYSYFYGYRMIVNKDVLIPRPETEELVSLVLQTYDEVFGKEKVDVVDIGTGSGAIGVTLAKEEPNMTVTATDISFEALEVAKKNALLNEVNVNFLQGDMVQPLIDANMKFDILVSNPPYITTKEYVQDIVLDNEPHVALFGGEDGLDFYKVILSNASKILKESKSILAFEHSFSKGKEMLELAHKYFPNGESQVFQDMNGKDRMLLIVNK